MERHHVVDLYDDGYASSYDERFLLDAWPRAGADFEAEVLRGLLGDDARWLDVGCGTGYFLSRFPEVERAGMDLSPSMLEQARAANPDAQFFHEGDFRDDVEAWHGAWSVVSCMWTAYNYVQSMPEFDQLIGNLIRWTRPGGSVFIPVMDLEDLRYVQVGYEEDPEVWGGTIALTGVTWTWDEAATGKHHEHLIAPHIGHFVKLLEPHFTSVEIVRYPVLHPGWISRKAIVATGRRPVGETGRADVVWHPIPRHPDEAAAAEAERTREAQAAAHATRAAAEAERSAAEAVRVAAEVEAERVERERELAVLRHENSWLRETYGQQLPPLPDGRLDLSGTSTKRLGRELGRRVNPLRPGFAKALRRHLPGGR